MLNFVIGKRSYVLANIVLLKPSFIAPGVVWNRIGVYVDISISVIDEKGN